MLDRLAGSPAPERPSDLVRLAHVKGLVDQARAELAQLQLPGNLDLEARRNLDTAAYQLETAGRFLRGESAFTSLTKKITVSKSPT